MINCDLVGDVGKNLTMTCTEIVVFVWLNVFTPLWVKIHYYFDYLMSALASSTVAIQFLRINCLAFLNLGSVSTLSGSAITVIQCNRRNCAILIAEFLGCLQLTIDFTAHDGGTLITILSSAQLASMRTFWFLFAVRCMSPTTMLSNI